MNAKAPAKGTITIPEDLSSLSDVDLGSLHDKAVEAFQAAYGDGSDISDEALEALSVLTEGINALRAESDGRSSKALARSDKAKDLADRVLAAGDVAAEVVAEGDEGDGEDPAAPVEEIVPEEESALVAAARRARERKKAARGPISIDLGALAAGRDDKESQDVTDTTAKKVVGFAAQGAAGYDVGREMTVADMAASINSRLGGFNASSYMASRSKGKRQQERFTIARLKREFPEGAIADTEDPKAAMKFATDEARLQGGSLVASGGWCAPSETLYDLVDISEAANLVSVPEIQINRGGIRHTLGPDYRTVFEDTGFCYTEEEDIEGEYEDGSKPVTTVPCPDFEDTRLGYCGVIIGAGLLQQRGYPEAIEDYINKTLTAHAHRMSASVINSMVAESDVITFAGPQAGAAAPLLTAIDLQATHYRAVNRMADDATLEVVLPTWIKAVIRSDLARRLGVDLLDVPEARINAWFAQRMVNVQYVVDWQDVATTPASGFLAAPTSVKFLMYAAGTFVKGVTDSITLENIYDSVLLGKNDYTALFTEDPFLVAKRNHDSRVVEVPIAATGNTHRGTLIAANGTFAN